jgi:hypothetical protein
VPEALLAIREEHQLLVMSQALTVEHGGQVSSRFRIVALDKAETLGWPIPGYRLAHDRQEVCFLVVPAAEIAAVESNGDGRRRRGQARACIGTAGEREDPLRAEFGVQATR